MFFFIMTLLLLTSIAIVLLLMDTTITRWKRIVLLLSLMFIAFIGIYIHHAIIYHIKANRDYFIYCLLNLARENKNDQINDILKEFSEKRYDNSDIQWTDISQEVFERYKLKNED